MTKADNSDDENIQQPNYQYNWLLCACAGQHGKGSFQVNIVIAPTHITLKFVSKSKVPSQRKNDNHLTFEPAML